MRAHREPSGKECYLYIYHSYLNLPLCYHPSRKFSFAQFSTCLHRKVEYLNTYMQYSLPATLMCLDWQEVHMQTMHP